MHRGRGWGGKEASWPLGCGFSLEASSRARGAARASELLFIPITFSKTGLALLAYSNAAHYYFN